MGERAMRGEILVHVIDDDEAFRGVLARLLAVSGFGVRTYACASDFLERLDGLDRGCVITDLHMPGMNGLELLRRLIERTDDFPVIVLTGRGNVAQAVDAWKAGAADFIEKPFETETLLDAVRTAMARLSFDGRRTASG
jgi:two-component system response regulator FixJ